LEGHFLARIELMRWSQSMITKFDGSLPLSTPAFSVF
jgi:hypothetical protein